MITREAKAILGSEEFDVEVWNELSFGSRFLNVNGYYGQPIDGGRDLEPERDPETHCRLPSRPGERRSRHRHRQRLLQRVAGWSPEESPAGLTAQDKHPYGGWRPFPSEESIDGSRPLNGLGEDVRDPEALAVSGDRRVHPYLRRILPRDCLSGIPNQTLVTRSRPRADLVCRCHARPKCPYARRGSARALDHRGEPQSRPGPSGGSADRRRTSGTSRRRSCFSDLVAYVNKGMTAIDFYAANDGNLSLIDERFFDRLKAARPTIRATPGRRNDRRP